MNDYFHSKRLNGILQQIDQFFAQPLFKNTFPVNVIERAKEHIITAELPGVNKEQINITIRNNYITITVNNEEFITEENDVEKVILEKQSFIKHSRTVTLPYIINVKNVFASYKNGVLQIIVKKEDGKVIEIE